MAKKFLAVMFGGSEYPEFIVEDVTSFKDPGVRDAFVSGVNRRPFELIALRWPEDRARLNTMAQKAVEERLKGKVSKYEKDLDPRESWGGMNGADHAISIWASDHEG